MKRLVLLFLLALLPSAAIAQSSPATFYSAGATAQNLEYLGGISCGGGTQSCGTITIPAKDILVVNVVITGYAGAAIASLRFNGDVGNTYTIKAASAAAAATAFTVVAAPAAQGFAKMFAVAATVGRIGSCTISNLAPLNKMGSCYGITNGPNFELAGFQWANTTVQITQIEFITDTSTLNAGSQIQVFGKNLNAP